MTIPAFVHEDLQRLGIELPQTLLDTLAAYLDRLLSANQRMNLTAIREPDAAWRRLIIDSLTILPWLDPVAEGGRVIDVGSGGGLPGLPVAIARGDLHIALLEATAKKATFLEETAKALALDNVHVHNARAEALGHMPAHRQQYDIAMSRAVGQMSAVLEWSLPLVQTGGAVLAMKGPKVEAELDRCGDALNLLGAGEVQVYDAYPAEFENNLVVVQVLKDRPTPKIYPREPGIAKRQPL